MLWLLDVIIVLLLIDVIIMLLSLDVIITRCYWRNWNGAKRNKCIEQATMIIIVVQMYWWRAI